MTRLSFPLICVFTSPILLNAHEALPQALAGMESWGHRNAPPHLIPEVFFELPDKYVQDLDISPDGRQMVFVESNARWDDFVLYSIEKRYDGSFTPPARPPFLEGFQGALRPSFSRDGNRLYFISKEPRDPWMSIRTRRGWSPPIALPEPINSDSVENAISQSADGTLWFCSHRQTPDSKGNCDLYYSKFEGGRHTEAVNLVTLNTEYNDCAPVVSPNGRYLVFHSNRPGGLGGADLYVSFADGKGGWSEPKNLGAPINTADMEVIAHFSPDGRYLLFTRRTAPADSGFSKIFWVSTEALRHIPHGAP